MSKTIVVEVEAVLQVENISTIARKPANASALQEENAAMPTITRTIGK